MIHQAKVLKTLLKKHNLTDKYGKLSVRTEHLKDGSYGNAVSQLVYLDNEICSALLNENKYIKIYNNKEHNFSVVSY